MNQSSHHEAPIPVTHEATMLSSDLHEWHERTDTLMAQGARIITFRGAGTVNGIEPGAAEAATTMLHHYVTSITSDGTPVVLMYDGDGDNRQKPDIGSVFGGLVDSLGDDPNVTAIAAQTEGWYSPETPNAPIQSATGKSYETYVFPDDVPGAHASLTQSEALANYAGYEQIFVGPAGPIAFDQLGDLNLKVTHRPAEAGKVNITVLATPNNPAIDGELNAQLDAASDDQTRAKVSTKLDQRAQQPYGALFTPGGEFSVDTNQFPSVAFAVHPVAAGITNESELQPAVTQEEINPNELRKQMDSALQRGDMKSNLETLLASGVSVNQEDFEGRTALMMGSAKGNKQVVELLLEHGAEINRVFMYHDRIPMTALDAAHQSGQNEIAEMLLGLGAKSGKELGPDVNGKR